MTVYVVVNQYNVVLAGPYFNFKLADQQRKKIKKANTGMGDKYRVEERKE